jgi:hypothetical protein
MLCWLVLLWTLCGFSWALPTKLKGQDLYLSFPTDLLEPENVTVTIQYNDTVFANLTVSEFQNLSRPNRSSYNKIFDILKVDNLTRLDYNPLLVGLKADTNDEALGPNPPGRDSNTVLALDLPVEWMDFFKGTIKPCM